MGKYQKLVYGGKVMEMSNNGWQNNGIMLNYAIENIPAKYAFTFLLLVRYSFGYGTIRTKFKTVEFWANKLKISKNTFVSHVSYLVEKEHIEQIREPGFVVGGGKKPYAYAPKFPNNAKIWIKGKEKVPSLDTWGSENAKISKTEEGMKHAIETHKKEKTTKK